MKSHNNQLAGILFFMLALLLNNAVVTLGDVTMTNGTAAIEDNLQEVDDNPAIGNDCQAGPCNRTPYIRHLWYAHATLMSVSFMILIPSAIMASLIRNLLPGANNNNKIGYKLHLILNGTALILIVCGFCIAVYIKQVTRSLPHFTMTCDHRAIGLAIFLLLVVHSTLGYFRPTAVPSNSSATGGNLKEGTEEEKEQSDEDHLALEELGKPCQQQQQQQKTTWNDSSSSSSSNSGCDVEFSLIRFVWEICHRFFGLVILMLGWYNCVDGFREYESDYDGEVLLARGPTVYLTLQGIMGGIILLLLSAKASKMKVF